MNSSSDISSMLKGLLSDPQMLSKVLGMAATLKDSGLFDALSGNENENPSSENEGKNESEDGFFGQNTDYSENEDDGENKENIEPSGNTEGSKAGKRASDSFNGGKLLSPENLADKNRIALIAALKPYLSHDKRDKAEMLLGILALLGNLPSFKK